MTGRPRETNFSVLPTVYAIDDLPVVRSSKLTDKTNEIIRDNGIRGLARTKKTVNNEIPKRVQPGAVGVSLLSQARANLAVEDKTPRSHCGWLSTFLMAAMTDGGLRAGSVHRKRQTSQKFQPPNLHRAQRSATSSTSIL